MPTSLGRGLGSLIPKKKGSSSASSLKNIREEFLEGASSEGALMVEISQISPNPFQPRQNFTPEELKELSQSIKEHGILQPLLVSKRDDGSYELIAGERRLKAAEMAGLKEVPVLLREVEGEREKLYLALIENLQRSDLDPLEEARAYLRLHKEFGLSHKEIAEALGKGRPTVSNTIRLLNLPEYIQKAIKEGKITSSQARNLVALPAALQKKVFEKIINDKLSIPQTEQIIQQEKRKTYLRHSLRKSPEVMAKEEQLQKKFDTKVTIKKRAGRGQIVIEFYSDEEFENLLKRLLE